jgi:hypothetical protein
MHLPEDLKSSPRARNLRTTLDFISGKKRTSDTVTLATRANFVTSGGTRASPVEYERLMGTNDLVDGSSSSVPCSPHRRAADDHAPAAAADHHRVG